MQTDEHAFLDGRPRVNLPIEAQDHGPIVQNGEESYGIIGARDVVIYMHESIDYMHYDRASDTGWSACLATSHNMVHWKKHGSVLEMGTSEFKRLRIEPLLDERFDVIRTHLRTNRVH